MDVQDFVSTASDRPVEPLVLVAAQAHLQPYVMELVDRMWMEPVRTCSRAGARTTCSYSHRLCTYGHSLSHMRVQAGGAHVVLEQVEEHLEL